MSLKLDIRVHNKLIYVSWKLAILTLCGVTWSVFNEFHICVCTYTQTFSHIYIYEDGTYSVCINVYLYIPPSVYLTGMYMSKAVCVYHIHINKIQARM